MLGSFGRRNTSSKSLAISNVDSLLGCVTACHLAPLLEKECSDVQIILLAQNPQKIEKLRKFKNVKIEKMDYGDVNSIQHALGDAKCLLIVPEMSNNRVQMNGKLVEAMKNCEIQGALFFSCLGADSDRQELQTFNQMETQVRDNVDCYTILRKGVINQTFMWWSKVIKERAEFPLSIHENSKFSPIDMHDYTKAMGMIVVEYCKKGFEDKATGGGKHHNKVYNLTGPRTYNPETLVEELNRVVGNKEHPVKYKKVSSEELKKILEENMEGGTKTVEEFDVSQCENLTKTGGGGFHGYKPNEVMIKLMLDEFEWINEGDAGFVSDDIRKITGHDGTKIDDFFSKEKDWFRTSK